MCVCMRTHDPSCCSVLPNIVNSIYARMSHQPPSIPYCTQHPPPVSTNLAFLSSLLAFLLSMGTKTHLVNTGTTPTHTTPPYTEHKEDTTHLLGLQVICCTKLVLLQRTGGMPAITGTDKCLYVDTVHTFVTHTVHTYVVCTYIIL